MRVLLTGAAGFIGKNLLARMANDDAFFVHALDLIPPEGYVGLSDDVMRAPNVRIHTGDAGTTDLVRTESIDVIIHLAGSAGVRDGDANPLHYIDNNLRATTHLFEEARRYNTKRIIYASSSSVYGTAAPPHTEDKARSSNIRSIYGLSKRMCESVAKLYHTRYGVESAGLRFFTVYGPHGRANMAVRAFAEAIHEDRPLTVFGTGEQTRDYTYVGDVVDAVIHTATHPDVRCNVFNVGAGGTISVNGLIELLSQLLGRPDYSKVVHAPRHPADVEATHANCDLIADTIGFRPKVNLIEGLKRFLAWRWPRTP